MQKELKACGRLSSHESDELWFQFVDEFGYNPDKKRFNKYVKEKTGNLPFKPSLPERLRIRQSLLAYGCGKGWHGDPGGHRRARYKGLKKKGRSRKK